MTSLVRRRLWISHLAVLGMGVIVGMLAWPARESAAEPAALSAKSDGASAGGRSAGGSKATTFPASHYAAAWETLKDGRLPRQERLEIQRSLLREWSVLDLEAAFRAVFAEGPGSQADLLEACDSGILADPSAAWALAMTRAVGWESARVRTRWLEIVADKDPLRVFPVLDQVSPSERTDAVEDLARAWNDDATDSGVRDAIWTSLVALGSEPWGDRALFAAGQIIGSEHRPKELDPLMAAASSPAGKKLLGSAYALSLCNQEDDEFAVEFPRIPAAMRAEVAAAGMIIGEGGSRRILEFAKLALAEGHLDAFPPAAAHYAFTRFSEETSYPSEFPDNGDHADYNNDPGGLADWALTLPDDPRVTGIYRIALQGAARRDYSAIRAKVEVLPPGWQRDHGIAALVESARKAGEMTIVDGLIETIGDPEIRAEARVGYRHLIEEE